MNYILINAETRAPVPLPFETTLRGTPVRVVGYGDEHCFIRSMTEAVRPMCFPQQVGLALITEAQFMAERGQ